MSQSIRESIYLLAELQASGYSDRELLERASELAVEGYPARRLLEHADLVYRTQFVWAA